jgi:ABC-type nitrate/sulfonate/bicarbonate transport system substrate-binding protein
MEFSGQSYRVPVAIAQQQGFFKTAGINLSTVEQPANLQGAQALTATHSQVGVLSTGTFTQGFQAGIPLKLFCGGINVLQTSLVALPDSNLPTSSDGKNWQKVLQALDGKTIGIQTPVGSGLQLVFAAALKEAGVTKVNYVNLGGAPTAIQAALQNHSVDVAQANPPGAQTLLANKVAKQLIYMPQGPSAYKDNYGSGFAAPNDWLSSNPDAAKSFCSAIDKANAFIADSKNADKVAQVVTTETGVPANVAKDVVPTFKDFSAKLDTARLQKTFDNYTQLGILKPEPKVTTDALVWKAP